MLYFAYGSNMSTARLTRRVPSAVPESTGRLYGHRLAFHKPGRKDGSGKCDAYVTGDESDHVTGVVYRIDPDHRHLLDRIEGLGSGYEAKEVQIKTLSGKEVTAFTYYATSIDTDLKPFHWYKEHVVRGAREHALHHEYIENLLSVESVTDPDLKRTQIELSIYG